MDSDDGASARRDGFRSSIRIDIERIRLYIDENGYGSGAGDSCSSRDKRNRGDNDFISWSDAEDGESQFQRDRAVKGADAVVAMLISREALFKFCDERMKTAPLRAVKNCAQQLRFALGRLRP